MKLPNVAFVSLEFGIVNEMKTYCGGLGILSGDILKSASDLNYPMTGFTLMYKNGWFKQEIDSNGNQTEHADTWDYKLYCKKITQINLNIKNTNCKFDVYIYKYKNVDLYLIDSDLESNILEVREASHFIYSTKKEVFDIQQAILGIGVLAIADKLNLRFDKYHLNESHAFYLPLELMMRLKDVNKVKEKLVFTTHTPLDTANRRINTDLITQLVGHNFTSQVPQELIINNEINCTELCIYFSGFSNSVAKRHQKITQGFFPNTTIEYVTNGAHLDTWLCDGLKNIFDTHIDSWRTEPNQLRRVGTIDDNILIENHQKNKQRLSDYINKNYNKNFDPNMFTIGFARRTVSYKRADLILSQIERLSAIAEKYNGIQIVFSGKAYPTDEEGKKLIQSLVKASRSKFNKINVVFIENYDMDLAKMIILGSDLWLNNPLPPLEASGTSGMKASMNGIPNFSIIDGWWVEGHLEGETGWSIGTDLCEGDMCRIMEIEDLYNKLGTVILEAYKDKKKWSEITKTCIALNATHFNTKRVLEEYILKAYLK